MRRAYKCRLYPNKEQVARLEQTLDLCRELYNAALQERRDAWQLNRVRISYFDQSKQITAIRAARPEMMSVQSRVFRQTLRQVDKAFVAFYRRVKAGQTPGYPRFKGKSFFNSFFFNLEGFKLIGNKLRLSNIGLVRIRLTRDVPGTLKQVTVTREGAKWYAILACDNIAPCPLPASTEAVGIDVGIENFATLSDGTQIDNWQFYGATAKRLRVAQRRVARRKKGSSRRKKAVIQLRAIHTAIGNQRRDFQHKLSTDLIRQYGLVAVEALNIKAMSRGILSKQILDVSWSSFIERLIYKAASAGRELVKVDARGTSQTCTCGAEVKKDLRVRWHECSSCGLSQHRDIVSAQIILSRGLRDQSLKWAVTPCLG